MPNYCDYEMKIRGSRKAINRVMECLKTDYNYGEGKPTHKHFFRVFDVNSNGIKYEGNGIYTIEVWGYCAWSIATSMLGNDKAKTSYYACVKESHPDIFMGTNLWEQSKDCEIELFGEETGMCFSEHYLFRNGRMVVSECVDIDCEFDEEEEECIIHNPLKIDGECFAYSI